MTPNPLEDTAPLGDLLLSASATGRAQRACTAQTKRRISTAVADEFYDEHEDAATSFDEEMQDARLAPEPALFRKRGASVDDEEYVAESDDDSDDMDDGADDDMMDEDDSGDDEWGQPKRSKGKKRRSSAAGGGPKRAPGPIKRARSVGSGVVEDADSIRAFWRSQGVTSEAQLTKFIGLSSSRKLYGDTFRIAAKLDELREVLPRVDVVKIVANAPNLLVYDIKTSIPPKLVSLKRLLPGMDVTKIVASSPHILTFDIEKNIGPKIRQLKVLLPGANVVKIVNAAPNLLSYDIEASLTHKIERLGQLLPGLDVVKLIQYAPTLLYHDTDNSIAPKLRQLKELMPDSDIVKMVSMAPPLLCSDIEGSVARKLHWIREMVQGGAKEVDRKIESNPRLLTCGYGVIFGRIEYKSKQHESGLVPVEDLRSILLTPALKFDKESQSGYSTFLASQIVMARRGGGKTVEELQSQGVKKLEAEYGNCLRNIVNKN